jgi:hypothetical protein
MFGRRRQQITARQDPAGHEVGGLVAVTTLEARPDTATLRRLAALNGSIGRGLAGGSGLAIGYDRGDPATTLTAAVSGIPQPTDALAAIVGSKSLQALPTPEYADVAMTDPSLDPFQVALWRRMVTDS